MPRFTAALAAVCAAVLSLAGAAGASTLGPASPGPVPRAVSVRGNQLELGGRPWLPRGVQIVGLVAPTPLLRGRYLVAHEHFSVAELLSAQTRFHVDMVRFQVSETGLDPDSPNFSAAYLAEVQQAVRDARALGLEAIVSVQAEPPSGASQRCMLPDRGTLRVWRELAPRFGDDHGVMFELYNEPALDPSPADWALWRDGGATTTRHGVPCTGVGMQTLIDAIRSAGAANVIVVPGLTMEQTYRGVPLNRAGRPQLTDPADVNDPQLVYGIHYPSLAAGRHVWNREFGKLSAHVPVLVTEWWASSASKGCSANQPQRVATLLRYLRFHDIGLDGFAFDIPGTIVAGWDGQPTSYQDFRCGVAGGGAGKRLIDTFDGEAAGLLPTL